MNEETTPVVEKYFSEAMDALERAAPDVEGQAPSFWREHVLPTVKSPAVWGSALVLTGSAVLYNGIDLPAVKASVAQWEAEVALKVPQIDFFVFKSLKFIASLVAADQLNSADPAFVQFGKFVAVGSGIASGGVMAAKIGSMAASATHFVENLPWVRARAIQEGTQALRPDEKPDRVIIGPTSLVSDVAAQREVEDHLVVAVHTGGIPVELGNTVDYHFPVGDFTALKSPKVIRETGMDRTKRITFLCINPNNGIFYGSDARPTLSSSSVSSVLRSLPPNQLRGLTVDVLLSQGFDYLGKTTSVIEEFHELEKEFGVTVHWRYLEDVVMDDFSSVVKEIRAKKTDAESEINILLVGEGSTQADKKMLTRFSEALKKLDEHVRVNMIDNETIGDLGTDATEEDKLKLLVELLKKSDLNIVYGDTDDGSTQAAELLIRVRGAERSQTVCVLESLAAVEEAKRANLLILSLYEKAIKAIS